MHTLKKYTHVNDLLVYMHKFIVTMYIFLDKSR